MTNFTDINNTFESYQKIINFYHEHKDKNFDNISIELQNWFAANMCAALGAILDLFTEQLNFISFNKIAKTIEQVLQKNDFLTYYGKKKEIDSNNTTIKFQKLTPEDGKYFNSYVINELINRSELPKMSIAVKEKIVEAIYEIFVNAQIHSETKNIYTCGQFFPKKNKIEFTIADTGIGFKNKINKKFNRSLNATDAIKWAVEDKHTTKDVSGGIGLALLKEFIILNKGKIQIISNDGFYEFGHEGESIKLFSAEFPGTIVNLEFCTNDNDSYLLKSEIDNNDIF
ncbi:MAG: ATP-binding protein [Bacteroidales bacterium]|jgi:anti-sigma regulatory factor (Ser/Thr protein kinase)|nr:ATP-binding protein [Bacteroidales bacterium]